MKANTTQSAMQRVSVCLIFVVLVALALFPLFADALGLSYYVGFLTRTLIFVLAAASLNVMMGYGGMVALGHAGFMGIGSYVFVALLDFGWTSAWAIWLVATLATALGAMIIGMIVIRTREIYFIMATLAFAQMLYVIAASVKIYGGDDGYIISNLPLLWSGAEAGDRKQFYWVVAGIVVVALAAMRLLLKSRFGLALVGIRDNETRMNALGYSVASIRLWAFVGCSSVAGLCGALLAQHNAFVSPASMHWTQSAILVVMVIIGGMGRVWAGTIGALIWIGLEEVLRLQTQHWHLPLGLILIALVLIKPSALLQRLRANCSHARLSTVKGE